MLAVCKVKFPVIVVVVYVATSLVNKVISYSAKKQTNTDENITTPICVVGSSLMIIGQ